MRTRIDAVLAAAPQTNQEIFELLRSCTKEIMARVAAPLGMEMTLKSRR